MSSGPGRTSIAAQYGVSMSLSNEKYMAFTTYKRDGTAVTSPVWVVPYDDDRVAFYTSSTSGKAKRLAHTSKAGAQPSDARGKVKEGTTPITGTAAIVRGAELEEIRSKIVAKYGFMTKVTKALAKLGGIVKRKSQPYADTGIVFTPD